MLKTKIASALLAVALFGTVATGAVAQDQNQRGGAAGLVAAVAQIAADDVVEVNVVDSLNNLTALNNILNNSPILSGIDIDVAVGDITVLQDFLNNLDLDIDIEDVLNDLEIDISDVVQIGILDTGDLIIFV